MEFLSGAQRRSSKEEKEAGANPKIVSYNASVVKVYNAANSIARFRN
jgi:hypothetical protein